MTENEIKKIESYIKRIKDKLLEYKKGEIIQEEKKDIYLTSNNDIFIIENELNMKIIELKEKLDELKLIENQNEEEKEFLLNKIKKYCNILTNGKFDKKYIDTEDIIEEDKYEDITKSFSNSFINKTQENNISYDDGNTPSLIHKKNKEKNILQLNQNFNFNINVNINLNHNDDNDNILKNNYPQKKRKNTFKKIQKVDLENFNSKME